MPILTRSKAVSETLTQFGFDTPEILAAIPADVPAQPKPEPVPPNQRPKVPQNMNAKEIVALHPEQFPEVTAAEVQRLTAPTVPRAPKPVITLSEMKLSNISTDMNNPKWIRDAVKSFLNDPETAYTQITFLLDLFEEARNPVTNPVIEFRQVGQNADA